MSALALDTEDVKLMLAAKVHVGAKNTDANMRRYVWGQRDDAVPIINLGKTWEKLVLAARIIVAIENPSDVVAISARNIGQRAVFKFASYTGALYVGTRYTPGTFTNQMNKRFLEPRLLIVTDPRTDHQPIKESSYMNIPVIAFCDTDANLDYVDVCIPCNNKGPQSIALMYWLLAREVLRMRGQLVRSASPSWGVMVDLFIWRDPEQTDAKAEDDETPVSAPLLALEPSEPSKDNNFDEPAVDGGWGSSDAVASWGDDVAASA